MRRPLSSSFSGLEGAIRAVGALDEEAMGRAQRRQGQLTKPRGSLGRLEELSIRLAGIRGQERPSLSQKAVITMAGDHGVVVEGVSAYPQEVTPQMVYNFLRGGAGINVLARHIGARVVVVDMGVAAPLESHPQLVFKKVAPGTRDMSKGPAMSGKQALHAVESGMEILEEELRKGLDIVGTGDMGIGNTTASSAIAAVFTGEPVERVTGRGTGLDEVGLARKVAVINRALSVNQPAPGDPLDVLSKVGGFEIGGLAGVMLGAAAHRIPVVIDGFISGAAALIACGLCPGLRDFLIASHVSAEPGHRVILRHLGLRPLLDLGMRLGEGTGACLGIFLCEAACRLLDEMATFGEAGVSEKLG